MLDQTLEHAEQCVHAMQTVGRIFLAYERGLPRGWAEDWIRQTALTSCVRILVAVNKRSVNIGTKTVGKTDVALLPTVFSDLGFGIS